MNDITVIIPTSPIRSHPDTSKIEETVLTIRQHLPDSEIIITFDGVRPEQEYLHDQYNEYKTQMLWKCLHEYKNVLPIVHTEHKHQSGMMRDVLPKIRTELLLYVESDTPITPDREIEWEKCVDLIYSGVANTVRFHFEEVIPEPHEELMIGEAENFIQTVQWSQRPHLSSVVYYRDEVMRHFKPDDKSFIEDVFYGVVVNDYLQDGLMGWYKHRLHIYNPDDPIGMKRSYNLDGRGNEQKYKQSFEL